MSHTLTANVPVAPSSIAATPAETTAPERTEPRVLDTYSLLYALTLVFLVPGAASLVGLPFRDYTFAYVARVALPGLLGLLAVFFTDSRDSLKTVLIRAAILSPLIMMTGVTVLFTSSFIALPIGQVLTPTGFDIAGPLATIMLVVLALPMIPTLLRSLRLPLGWRSVVHVVALLFAIAVVATVLVRSTSQGWPR